MHTIVRARIMHNIMQNILYIYIVRVASIARGTSRTQYTST